MAFLNRDMDRMSVHEIGVYALTLLNHEKVLIVMPVKRRRFAGLEKHFPDFDAFVFEQQLGCHVAKFVITELFSDCGSFITFPISPVPRPSRFAGLRRYPISANGTLALELGDRVLGDAQFEKNFVGVLSQTRGVPINRRRRAFEADGRRHVLHCSEPRVFVGHDALPMHGLGVNEEIVE